MKHTRLLLHRFSATSAQRQRPSLYTTNVFRAPGAKSAIYDCLVVPADRGEQAEDGVPEGNVLVRLSVRLEEFHRHEPHSPAVDHHRHRHLRSTCRPGAPGVYAATQHSSRHVP